jgi:hypothetical protein
MLVPRLPNLGYAENIGNLEQGYVGHETLSFAMPGIPQVGRH